MNRSRLRAALRAAGAGLAAMALLSPPAPSLAEGAPPRPYARAGIGVFLLDLPGSSPFIETDSAERLTGFLDHYDAARQTGGRVGLAIGASGFPAGGLFLEARGFAARHRASHLSEYERTSGLWDALEARQTGVTPGELQALTEAGRKAARDAVFADDARREALIDAVRADEGLRFAGWIGAVDGQPLRFTPNFLWGDAVRARTARKTLWYGIDPVVGMPVGAGGARLALFAGPSVRVLSQRSDTRAHEVTHRAPDDNFMTLNERLRGVYIGAVAGGRLEAPLGERWTASVGGDAGLYRLEADYRGRQRTRLAADPPIDVAAALDLRDSRTAAALRLRAGLGAALAGGLTLRLEAGAEVLSHAPQMDYARAGAVFANGVAHEGARLDYGAARGFFAALAVRAAF